MPYTNPFNATLIPGNTQAKLIDDTFRSMHAAIIERLNDKVVVDATADPWVLKSEVSGSKENKVIPIPFINFITAGGGGTTIFEDHITTTGTSNPLYAGVTLPYGVIVRDAAVYLNTVAVVNLEFYLVTSVPPFTKTSIAAWQTSTTGQQISANGTRLDHTVNAFYTHYISVDLAAATGQTVSVYGGYVLYDTPSHLNTL